MSKDRFEFGKNWAQFLEWLDDERIENAEQSLRDWLGVETLQGKTFLDVGSGSGLFSLAARKLGASVSSFDYDVNSVKCTRILRKKYDDPKDPDWKVERGDALDSGYLSKYPEQDIVYSWGVLHHTGDMYRALGNMVPLVKDGGNLMIAIYNDQGVYTRMWKWVKKTYNSMPEAARPLLMVPVFIRMWGPPTIKDFLRLKPFATWKARKEERGMSAMVDFYDWIGGWPFETAKPEEILDFYRKRGFTLEKLYTCGNGKGCNQFLFKKG
ncbi:MAG: class I SAM-dependent methyltransferase [Lachnospiraceae bacterium]|nr:class I SAM-dependent methyltransferase [Lachnospiraceae bacterium]